MLSTTTLNGLKIISPKWAKRLAKSKNIDEFMDKHRKKLGNYDKSIVCEAVPKHIRCVDCAITALLLFMQADDGKEKGFEETLKSFLTHYKESHTNVGR